MASRTFYEFWVKSPDLAFSASPNGIVLHVDRFQASSEWSQTINQWVLEGEDTFRFLLHVGPHQHEGLEPGVMVQCELREIVASDGEATTRILAASEWAYDEGMSWQ